jgi:acetolactate synthase regulatory subunit
MKTYQVRYRNTQGTFLRILTAVQRRGLDMSFVHAEKSGDQHLVTLALQMNAKQAEQVSRDWHAIMDVDEVSVSDLPKMAASPVLASPSRLDASQPIPRFAGATASA